MAKACEPDVPAILPMKLAPTAEMMELPPTAEIKTPGRNEASRSDGEPSALG